MRHLGRRTRPPSSSWSTIINLPDIDPRSSCATAASVIRAPGVAVGVLHEVEKDEIVRDLVVNLGKGLRNRVDDAGCVVLPEIALDCDRFRRVGSCPVF